MLPSTLASLLMLKNRAATDASRSPETLNIGEDLPSILSFLFGSLLHVWLNLLRLACRHESEA